MTAKILRLAVGAFAMQAAADTSAPGPDVLVKIGHLAKFTRADWLKLAALSAEHGRAPTKTIADLQSLVFEDEESGGSEDDLTRGWSPERTTGVSGMQDEGGPANSSVTILDEHQGRTE